MSKLTAYFEAQSPAVGGCEATKGDAPLLCCCGNHSALWRPPKHKQPGAWLVFAVKVKGQKPRLVTTLSNREKALARVSSMCGATNISQDDSNPTPQSAPTQQPEHRHSSRVQQPVNYRDTPTRASRRAGPGRGHTNKKRAATPLEQATAVLKKSKPTINDAMAALSNLTNEHRLLQRWYQPVSYTHLRAHETPEHLVCRLLLEKKKKKT
eukprot:TRINITY_DN2175_c0_g1_i2.p1 TRINITY_DN2175_c0_g1~~TRINITY_DN2175_c0_g1_i2.p1  ORF type:complete len:210 (-),score=34.39 TRINITY_DN2175_c0_g1_i2:98-727(-)